MSSDIDKKLGMLFLDQAIASAKEGELKKMSEQVENHHRALRRLAPVRTYWINDILAYVADKLGEEEVSTLWTKWLSHGFENFDAMGPKGQLEWMVESHNALGSVIKSVEEKEDCYVLTLEPCGSGGIIRRKRMVGPGRGVTKKGYPWSWGKEGVPYYCAHCAIGGEIIPMERKGKAWYIMDYSGDPQGSCVYNFLK